jgi:predicted Zn finger-like uncharacterized protein
MILTCPTCATRFVIDAGALGGQGRSVRCGACGNTWHQQATAPAAYDPPPLGLEDVVTAPLDGRSRGRGFAGTISRFAVWFMFIGVVGSIVWGGYRYRQEIVDRWPMATRVYDFLDIKVRAPMGYGLHVPKGTIRARRASENGVPILVISGEIVNGSAKPILVGRMRITLLDEDSGTANELRTWIFTPGARTLGPSKRMVFQTSISNPPTSARAVRIKFVNKGGT